LPGVAEKFGWARCLGWNVEKVPRMSVTG
jgi:hypothetical protein